MFSRSMIKDYVQFLYGSDQGDTGRPYTIYIATLNPTEAQHK